MLEILCSNISFMSTVNFAPLLKLLEIDSCTLVGRNSALGYMYMHMYMYMYLYL